MVQEAIQTATETASNVVTKMADRDPLSTWLMILVSAALIWSIWDNHSLKEQLVDMKLTDKDIAHERRGQIDDFIEQLKIMRESDSESREKLWRRLAEFKEAEAERKQVGERAVSDILESVSSHHTSVKEALDHIINNQQIRSVIRAPQGQQQ